MLANASRAVEALDGKVALSDEALLVSAYRATQYRNRNQRGSTFDEMISTGSIELIRDPTLRDTAVRLYKLTVFDNLVREGMRSRYREAFRMSLPNDVQRALGKHCGVNHCYLSPVELWRKLDGVHRHFPRAVPRAERLERCVGGLERFKFDQSQRPMETLNGR